MTFDNTELFAFVLMPFDASFEDVYRFGIKEPARDLGILAERVDEQIYREGILDRIYRQIEVADIVIADMSGRNPNVFYEVGYAHAKDKFCILLTSNADDIPFDLKHHRHVVYEGSIKLLAERMHQELDWAKTEIQNVKTSKIKVTLQDPVGLIEKGNYFARGSADFKIDLTNESASSSPEIEAVYFYSTKRWRLYQNGTECPWTSSDLPDFDKRHFLSLPVRVLHSGAWAQLQFEARTTLASGLAGEPIKDSYRTSGHSTLRLVTEKGLFDYTLYLNIEFTDIPF
jgi:nucleoside 2-deoxyribosyltransferase